MTDELKLPIPMDPIQAPRVPDEFRQGGRPTIMTQEVIKKLKEGFMFGCTDEEACAWADISKATLYNYQTKYPEFLDQKEEWKSHPVLKARATVYNDLNSPETARWYLERKRRSEFATRTENTGADGADIIPRIIERLDKTDYSGVAEEARKQMVAINAPVQDQGQTGQSGDVPPQLPPVETPSGEGEPPPQPNPES